MKRRVIFKITNLINDKIYIGKKSGDIPSYYGSGISILNAIKKYGKENFKKEILDIAETLSELNDKEKYWISFHNSNNYKVGYNRSAGGGEGFDFNTMDDQIKKKRDKLLRKIWKSKSFSKQKRNDTLNYYSDINNRKKRSDNQKEIWKKYSKQKKDEILKNYSKAGKKSWKNNSARRKKASNFFKQNNFSKKLGKYMSENRKGGNNPYASPIIIDDVYYESIQTAVDKTKLSRNVIVYRLKLKKFKNYKYAEKRRRKKD